MIQSCNQTNASQTSEPDYSGWRRTLGVVWLSQFLAMMGFFFGIPFAPLYFQRMGVTDPAELSMWVALFGAATPLTMAIASPVWGSLSDRMGRKVMLVRSYLGTTIVLGLMAVVHQPVWLVALRLLQGGLSGTVPASQVLVSEQTPPHRQGTALGILNSSLFSGMLAGAALGGVVADKWGFRAAFFISGALMLFSAMLVLLCVREAARPVMSKDEQTAERRGRIPWQDLRLAMPILILVAAVMFARQFDVSFLALLVQNVNGGLQGAASITGLLMGVCGVAGVFSGVLVGWITDRRPVTWIGALAAALAGIAMIPQAFLMSVPALFGVRFLMTFASGGLEPFLQICLTRITPEGKRGLLFGFFATARSIGWFTAPLLAGVTVSLCGLRSLFVIGGLIYWLLIPLFFWAMLRGRSADNRSEPAAVFVADATASSVLTDNPEPLSKSGVDSCE